MGEEFRFEINLPANYRITGRLLLRDMTSEEDREYRAELLKAYRLKRSVTRVREQFFDRICLGGTNLKRHGHGIDPNAPNWLMMIPAGVKDDVMADRFEWKAREDAEDDEKNSDGPSES